MDTALAISAPGLWEIVFLAVLALLIFGPDKLPGIARNVGRTIATFRREATSTIEELQRSAELDEFRDVARDLRSTGEDLRRSAGLDDLPATGRRRAGSRRGGASESVEAGPPPFDPDAT